MSLFASPEEHAANPPESWEVVKVEAGRWSLRPAGAEYGFQTFNTQWEALGAKEKGSYAELYRKESDWYAGLPVAGWKSYEEVVK